MKRMVTAVLVSQLEVDMENDFIRKTEKPVGNWQLIVGMILLMFAVIA